MFNWWRQRRKAIKADELRLKERLMFGLSGLEKDISGVGLPKTCFCILNSRLDPKWLMPSIYTQLRHSDEFGGGID